jgi:hypothetical protein
LRHEALGEENRNAQKPIAAKTDRIDNMRINTPKLNKWQLKRMNMRYLTGFALLLPTEGPGSLVSHLKKRCSRSSFQKAFENFTRLFPTA